jgi:ribonuclease HI
VAERKLFIYADGSCLGNPGPGGWGVIITESAGLSASFSGGEPSTTNNRMELTAAIEGLSAIAPGQNITLRSDSLYLVNTMRLGWKRRKNFDLWQKLDAAVARHQVSFEWVEGHAGDPLNEEADQLARAAAAKVARSGKPVRLDAEKAGLQLSLMGLAAPSSAEPDTEKAAETTCRDEGLAGQIKPLLAHRESICRCAGCGRAFVARSQSERYCALLPCQLKARKDRR